MEGGILNKKVVQEYKEVRMSKLGLEFVIENHKFMDVDIKLDSSYIVIPYRKGLIYIFI